MKKYIKYHQIYENFNIGTGIKRYNTNTTGDSECTKYNCGYNKLNRLVEECNDSGRRMD